MATKYQYIFSNLMKLYCAPKHQVVPWPSWLRHRANNAGISGSILLGTIVFLIPFYLISYLLMHMEVFIPTQRWPKLTAARILS